MEKLIIGSRGSLLAKTQTQQVIQQLQKVLPGLLIEWKQIDTSGDLDTKTQLTSFGSLGVFVKELQLALIKGDIHVAVHSLKDVPENQPEELILSCFPLREEAADVWIGQVPFASLTPGSKVGTGSPRRQMQLSLLRPDLEFIPLRGNLETRIAKVSQAECAGIVLAQAGLRRLGWENKITHPFTLENMIPAIGQGALALECRQQDVWVQELLQAIHDTVTARAVRLERALMSQLGGGCRVPLAAHACLEGQKWKMYAALGHPNKKKMIKVVLTDDDEERLLKSTVEKIENLALANNLPLPRDVPEHYLLQTGFSAPAKK